jgi:hypothetical protein
MFKKLGDLFPTIAQLPAAKGLRCGQSSVNGMTQASVNIGGLPRGL